ncbi:MAG: NAD(P)H-hydrate dehydratase [Parasporobacterium sp.]|nr:NAD(P)H-hydrate dehydratase [Parasporobacterium sp.]
MILMDSKYFHVCFPKRKADAHKGDFGRILLFTGSPGMAGAAVLCGKAALRSGAGLTRFLLPSFKDPLYPILQVSVPEATCVVPEPLSLSEPADPVSFKDPVSGPLSKASYQIPDIGEYQAIAAGSGLGGSAIRRDLLKQILNNYSGKLILDADALNMIAREEISIAEVLNSSAEILLTPHIGEAKRLLDTAFPIRTEEERLKAAKTLAMKYQCAVLLKGPGTLIVKSENEREKAMSLDSVFSFNATDPADFRKSLSGTENWTIYKNTTGNPGMAVGGSGDVLTGIITAFAGAGLSLPEAAACGAYIHGKAGDLAAEELGEVCMNASDIIRYLPKAWKDRTDENHF